MPHNRRLALTVLALILVLPGCRQSRSAETGELEPDPAIVAALAEPIMTDPDLAAQNRGNAAIVIGSFDGVPGWTRDPDEIAAERVAAARLAGGSLSPAPAAAKPSGSSLAYLPPGIPARCVSGLANGFGWAVDLPKATPIYPGGHVEQAAGARERGCGLRVLRYMTSAERQDVLDFHYTLLSRAGYRVERESAGALDVLTAHKGDLSARIIVGTVRGGMTEVGLAARSEA